MLVSDCRSRQENRQLSTDYSQLEQSYRELEQLKDTLQHKEETWILNLTDAQKAADNTKAEVCIVGYCKSLLFSVHYI